MRTSEAGKNLVTTVSADVVRRAAGRVAGGIDAAAYGDEVGRELVERGVTSSHTRPAKRPAAAPSRR